MRRNVRVVWINWTFVYEEIFYYGPYRLSQRSSDELMSFIKKETYGNEHGRVKRKKK